MDHFSVLKKEIISKLLIKPNGIYVDCTLGHAGHSKSILENLTTGKLFAFEIDEEAIRKAKIKLSSFNNFEIINSNFKNLSIELKKRKINNVDGFIFDLGTNYDQLTNPERGFTFKDSSTLDMRMDREHNKLRAIDILNTYDKDELKNIFYKGQIKEASKLSNKIIESRPIKNAEQLNSIIDSIIYKKNGKNRLLPIYQALRIEVNDELNSIEKAIKDATKLLNSSGSICVITFHSLEDKIVKHQFINIRENSKTETLKEIKFKFKTEKVIYPSKIEIEQNRPSRSAKLRILRHEK